MADSLVRPVSATCRLVCLQMGSTLHGYHRAVPAAAYILCEDAASKSSQRSSQDQALDEVDNIQGLLQDIFVISCATCLRIESEPS